MILLMIVGVTFYGRTIAKQVAWMSQRKELYRIELEQRVAERTKDLTAANEAKANLLKQLFTAQEDERRRIARDLHDGIGQGISYLLVSLQRLKAASPTADTNSPLNKLCEVTAETLDEVRRIARGLRPSVLDDLGLQPALERLLSDFGTANHLRAEFTSEFPREQRFSEGIEITLYRIVQEALSNVAKHAQAKNVIVHLTEADGAVVTEIHDDGQGFDLALAIAGNAAGKSMGVSGVRERAANFGGTVEYQSGRNQGTVVRVRIPLPMGNEKAE
jgi:signal transduction histidine kinase